MLDIERSSDANLCGDDGTRCGWLCDEVGMGKMMVCISLILAHPYPHQDVRTGECKTTLIICQNTLVQQWVDEVHMRRACAC